MPPPTISRIRFIAGPLSSLDSRHGDAARVERRGADIENRVGCEGDAEQSARRAHDSHIEIVGAREMTDKQSVDEKRTSRRRKTVGEGKSEEARGELGGGSIQQRK